MQDKHYVVCIVVYRERYVIVEATACYMIVGGTLSVGGKCALGGVKGRS